MKKEYLKQVKRYIINSGTLDSCFGKFSKIYNMTTENIYGFLKNYDLKDKKVLTVAGSGDQRLNAYLLGAKEVTCFDINPLTELNINLKDEAIKSINFEKYINFFDIYSKKYGSYYEPFDSRIFDEFRLFLDQDTYSFYNFMINEANISNFEAVYYNLLKDLKLLSRMNGYLDPDSYEKLRKKINSKENIFIESDINSLSNKLNGEKFDMILLSNISDYTHRMYDIHDLKHFRDTIEKLGDNLNMYGTMQVGYVYAKYSEFDDVGDFRYKEERNKFFPDDVFNSTLVDSYMGINFKDEVITYQKIK